MVSGRPQDRLSFVEPTAEGASGRVELFRDQQCKRKSVNAQRPLRLIEVYQGSAECNRSDNYLQSCCSSASRQRSVIRYPQAPRITDMRRKHPAEAALFHP